MDPEEMEEIKKIFGREATRCRARLAEPTRYWFPFRAERDTVVVGLPRPPDRERKIAKWVYDNGAPLLEGVQDVALFASDCWRGRHGIDVSYIWGRVARPWSHVASWAASPVLKIRCHNFWLPVVHGSRPYLSPSLTAGACRWIHAMVTSPTALSWCRHVRVPRARNILGSRCS